MEQTLLNLRTMTAGANPARPPRPAATSLLLLWFLLLCFLSLYGRLGISHYSGSRLRCFRCRCFNRFCFLPDLGNRCGWLLLLRRLYRFRLHGFHRGFSSRLL